MVGRESQAINAVVSDICLSDEANYLTENNTDKKNLVILWQGALDVPKNLEKDLADNLNNIWWKNVWN